MRPERDKKLYDISCPAGFASHIGCYKTSWCHVLMCDVSHVAAWHGEWGMETQGEMTTIRDTGKRQDRGESSVPVPCPPWLHWCEEQWLHVTRVHHNHQFYCLVSWNRKSVHSLAPWVVLFSNASNAFNFSSNGRHCCCLLLSYCNYQLFSCNAPCSFALKSLVQALSQLKIPHFRCWARTGLKPEHNCTLCVQIKYLENLLSQSISKGINIWTDNVDMFDARWLI